MGTTSARAGRPALLGSLPFALALTLVPFPSHDAALAREPAPEAARLLFHNARIAAANGRATDVIKLWFAQTQFLAAGGDASWHADFRSVLWWAVAHGGLCPDLLEADDRGGAGLWPLALHDHIVANLSPRKSAGRETPPPFDAFERAKQARRVHPDDRLSLPEILSYTFVQGSCGARREALWLSDAASVGGSFPVRRDRPRLARAMQVTLQKALATVDPAKVEGLGIVRARIFDLEVYLADQKTRAAKKPARRRPGEEVEPDDTRAALAQAEAFHAEVARWPEADWRNLSRARRLFLYPSAKEHFEDPARRDALLLALLDEAIARRDGAEALSWIAHYEAQASPERRKAIWAGERGARLLTLDNAAGFTERAVVQLHRAIDDVEAGRSREALRSLAAAVASADSSADAEALRVLTRRWLTFVLGNFKVEDDVLSVLRDTLPREDAAVIQEDLAWRAALRADRKGFDALAAEGTLRSAAARRVGFVAPLARGDVDAYFTALHAALTDDPRAGSRELDTFLGRVERDDADVRARLRPLLSRVRTLVLSTRATEEKDAPGSRTTKALDDLLVRLDALLGAGNVRSLAPSSSVFAGVVRVPPAGDVPWPFTAPAVEPPSIFSPLRLAPVDRNEGRVAAWRVSE